jgi:arsenate reductase
MNNFTIYHNPRCSKSRQTLELIKANGIDPSIVLYLEEPPTAETLSNIINLLKLKPRDLLRKSEDEYKALNLKDTTIDDIEIIKFMSKYPKLIERPIVISGKNAILGRPPENVLSLIN